MKLPWSSKTYQYSVHSAPITNGILRNGKGASNNRSRQHGGILHVTFAVRRTGSSQIPLHAIKATLGPTSRLPKEEHPGRRRINYDDDEQVETRRERNRDQPLQQPRTRRERKGGSSDLTSSVLSESSLGDVDKRSRSTRTRKDWRGSSDLTSSYVASVSSLESDKQRRSTQTRKERRGSTDLTSPSVTGGGSLDSNKQRRSTKTTRKDRRGSSDFTTSSVTSGGSLGSDKQRRSTKTRAERKGGSDLTSSNVSDYSGGSSEDMEKPRKSASEYSEGSADTLGSLVEKPYPIRLGDLPPEKFASGYGKWESNGTLDTADISDFSEEQQRTSLAPRGGRTSLSLLLDEKIEAKMRRQGQEKTDI